MAAALSIAGQKFGRLTAMGRIGPDHNGKIVWDFVCDCGTRKAAVASIVKNGKVRSCGCLGNESRSSRAKKAGDARGAQMTKHGHAGQIPEYGVWKTMRQRCNNPNNSDYPAYGGRGIRVCARWDDFAAFLQDMGRRPTNRHSIDRVATNGNYEPSNCRWADDFEQAANRRPRGAGEYAQSPEH